MPKIDVSVSHSLNRNEAKKRISNLLSKLKIDFKNKINGVHENWNGFNSIFSFKIHGMKMQGEIAVYQNSVNITGNVPLAAMMFRGVIEQTIRKEAVSLLR